MKAFLIDPLKVGDHVVSTVDVDDLYPMRDVCALLGLPSGAPLETVVVGKGSPELHLFVADPAVSADVRRLGEFRIMKSAGDYRSIAGRGVVLDPKVVEASYVMGLLASSGVWVSA